MAGFQHLIPLTRLSDWEQRLALLLAIVRDRPHVWGQWDCGIFAGYGIEAVTGVNPVTDTRGAYSTEAGLMRWLRRKGCETAVEMASERFGEVRAPLMAMRGDIVHDGHALGVRWGNGGLFIGQEPGREGLIELPLSDLRGCWWIGHG